jgi:hypothetical protein
MEFDNFWAIWMAISIPVGMAVFAAGAVLAIKIQRRRQATRDGQSHMVPADPLSAQDARKMWRRYAAVAAVIVGLIGISALVVVQ